VAVQPVDDDSSIDRANEIKASQEESIEEVGYCRHAVQSPFIVSADIDQYKAETKKIIGAFF
jgi:hypothetical protein